MTQFNQDDLKKLTKLCHIECTPEEEARLLKNMVAILDYIDQLREVNTDLTLGKHNPLECSVNVLAEDIEETPLEREEFLTNAPSHVGGMVRIPPVIQF
jgi:aspartyl-tRNA(Asn)/glutamyl-tRNA(Gln) amidotransferase subunit C